MIGINRVERTTYWSDATFFGVRDEAETLEVK
jgi:hypothetical protein